MEYGRPGCLFEEKNNECTEIGRSTLGMLGCWDFSRSRDGAYSTGADVFCASGGAARHVFASSGLPQAS